jgi:hypothetical protein
MDMAKSLKNILKKFISYFHTKQKFKNYVLACIVFALITNLIKSWELNPYLKKYQRNILFSFNIWDYELIRKTYFWY